MKKIPFLPYRTANTLEYQYVPTVPTALRRYQVPVPEQSLDGAQALPLSLRDKEEAEEEGEAGDAAKDPEGAGLADGRHQVREELGDQEGEGPVEGGGNGGGRASHLAREQLGHHQPGDRAEADGEGEDKDGERGDGEDLQLLGQRRVVLVLLDVEEGSEDGDGDEHEEGGEIEKHPPAWRIDLGQLMRFIS